MTKPLTDETLRLHLAGKLTVGCYQLSEDNMVKYFCFDIDPEHLEDPKTTTKRIISACLERPDGENPRVWPNSMLLEASRYPDPSYHLWIFFAAPFPANAARWLGLRILEIADITPNQVEVFPKQSELTEDRAFGNLIKLPLGKHQAKGKWSCFLDLESFQPLDVSLENVKGMMFSEDDIQRILGFVEKRAFYREFELPVDFKPLEDEDEEKSARFLAKYWVNGYRNTLEISFLGLCLKRGVSYQSAHRIIDRVCELTNTSVDDRRVALDKVKYHYEKRRSLGSKLLASSGIREVIKELVRLGLV